MIVVGGVIEIDNSTSSKLSSGVKQGKQSDELRITDKVTYSLRRRILRRILLFILEAMLCT